MSATNSPPPAFWDLYCAYREAWNRFCFEIEVLQSLSPDTANALAIEAARNRVRDAEVRYRARRDELADHLLASTRLSRAGADTPKTRRFQLEQLAYRLWQEGGRHDGNADGDWYRAEQLLSK